MLLLLVNSLQRHDLLPGFRKKWSTLTATAYRCFRRTAANQVKEQGRRWWKLSTADTHVGDDDRTIFFFFISECRKTTQEKSCDAAAAGKANVEL